MEETPIPEDYQSSQADDFLEHFGVKGMKWGVRKKSSSSLSRKDDKWVKKKSGKIKQKAQKKTAKDLDKYAAKLMSKSSSYNKSGRVSSKAILSYNKKAAQLMNKQVEGITSPSGKTISFVAKRGKIGVFTAISDKGYNMNQLKNGLFSSGKVGYRKKTISKV